LKQSSLSELDALVGNFGIVPVAQRHRRRRPAPGLLQRFGIGLIVRRHGGPVVVQVMEAEVRQPDAPAQRADSVIDGAFGEARHQVRQYQRQRRYMRVDCRIHRYAQAHALRRVRCSSRLSGLPYFTDEVAVTAINTHTSLLL
jgi:hypothetical protein